MMAPRALARLLASAPPKAAATDLRADGSGATLASYYDRHMALADGVAWGWQGRGTPRALLRDVVQVGVGKDAWFALQRHGTLITWRDDIAAAQTLMRGVARFAAGDSGWFAIDREGVLWAQERGARSCALAQGDASRCQALMARRVTEPHPAPDSRVPAPTTPLPGHSP